jgi:hypothetical protein
MARLKNETFTETLNPETREVVINSTTKTFSTRVKNQEQFYMTYIGLSSIYLKIKSLTDIQLLAVLCERAEYNTGVVQLPTKVREDVIRQLNITNPALSRSLKKLKELKLITGSKGEFTINPKIFWKGSSDVRTQLIKEGKLTLSFDFEFNED